ncbi:MAG: Rpn family recombination-promoting nuclease/putative transposase [Planctomycetota bacterium]|nr:Rpn family recombination-promoting nuclease/putative transposase [Planctomycetota bacterium]
MASHHDSLFHRTFADPANAAAMFRLALPAALVAAIDWSTLTELTSKITDDDLKNHLPDHLFSVRLRDHDFVLFLVPEHKSSTDPGYVLQKLRYSLHIWGKWTDEHPGENGLPPIIPVLFHHGNEPWCGPTSLLGHFDIGGLDAVRAKDPELAAIIAASGVSLAASVLDLAVHDEEWLRKAEFPDLAKLVVLCMRFVRFQDPTEGTATLDRWRDLIAAVHNAPRGQSGLAGVESYLLEITDLTLEQLRDVVQRALGTGDEMTKFTSTADRLRQEGQAKGEALGEARGEARGRIKTVLRLLDRRFGNLPDPIVQRVAAATLAELDLWTDRILDARTIDEVFAAD